MTIRGHHWTQSPSGEFAYARQGIHKGRGGSCEPENLNALTDTADMVVALDRLQAMAPKVESVSLVVALFGDDLRAGSYKVRPDVEITAKSTTPSTWSVNGVSRANAFLISRDGHLGRVIPPKISGVQKWNFLGKISEEIFDEDSTI